MIVGRLSFWSHSGSAWRSLDKTDDTEAAARYPAQSHMTDRGPVLSNMRRMHRVEGFHWS